MSEAQKTNTEPISSERIVIEPLLQQTKLDCGQTCLDMLGYDGHGMIPDREMSSPDLRAIDGVQELSGAVGDEETIDYSSPVIWHLLGKDKGAGAMHWVIRYGDTIFCPSLGAMDAKDYKDKYVAFVLQKYSVPFAGSAKTQVSPTQEVQRKVRTSRTARVIARVLGRNSN